MEKTRKGALQFDLSFSKDGGFCEIFHECTAALPACWAKTDPQPKHWVLLHLTEATTVTSAHLTVLLLPFFVHINSA